MTDGGINKWKPPRKAGRTPRVSTRFGLSVENDQADAGRRTVEPVSGDQILGRANGDREISIFPVQLTTTSRFGNLLG